MAKMSNRDFLMGIGVGCILSAGLVFFFNPAELSDQEIMSRAASLGMVKRESLAKPSAASSPQPTASPSPKPAASPSPQPAAKSTPQPTTEPSPESEVNAKVKTVSITIKRGMGSETISRLLEEKGAVEDQYEFYRLVTLRKAHSSFRTGTFNVPVGDMDAILKMLTGK